MNDPFIHLRTVSGFSLRHGVATPAQLVEAAVQLGQRALGLTDRDGVYGAVRFAQACQDAGIAPILGVDLAVAESTGDVTRQTPPPRLSPARGGPTVREDAARLVVLARGGRGWAALCRLVSAAHLRGERGRPRVTREIVAQYAADGHLAVLLGADSTVGLACQRRRPDLAAAELRWWHNEVGPAVYVEICSHLEASGATRSSVAAARLLRVARDTGTTAVLTNAVRYATPEQAPVADVLDAVRRLVPISRRHLDRTNAQGYLKSWPELRSVADEVTAMAGGATAERARLLADTVALAERCVLDPIADIGLGDIHVPELAVVAAGAQAERAGDVGSVLAGYESRRRSQAHIDQEARHAHGLLSARCGQELDRRRLGSESAERRLAAELAVIGDLGFAGYFLTVVEVVDLIRDMGVRVAARGSGAGSLVNYLLGISGVDPLRHNLLMERFLSPLRRSLPDIDVDVESARRSEIYERILARFGGERCTCVSMRDTYRVRHAIRDVGAALGMAPGDVDAFAKAFPHIRAAQVREALAELPEVRTSDIGRRAATGELEVFLDLVAALDGLPRHIAVHPCGVLLSDATMLDRTPVEASWQGFPMSQFDKDDVEALGFLKLDVLGIRMQSAMQYAVAEIGRVDGQAVVLDEIPLDDPDTFALIGSTRTLGCFQIESPGQRELLGKFGPRTFDDIIIDISLFRPGPVKSDMIAPFLAAHHGWREPEFPHPDLRPALAETYGVVVYHEQVLRIVATMTGCSLAEADEVRRSMGSPESQEQIRGWFYGRAHDEGYELGVIEQVWQVLRSFASFGFCKAHAAAFALPTYQSAWLKRHHPAAFLAGVLTHDPGMYPKRLILDDARHFGIEVLPLDINASGAHYRVERAGTRYGIRLALAEVKGISTAEVERVVAGQPYTDLSDFWLRAQVSRPVVENLIITGACDSMYGLAVAGGNSRLTRRDLLLQAADLDRLEHRGRRRARGVAQPAARRVGLGGSGQAGSDPAGGVLLPGELDVVRSAGVQSAAPLGQPTPAGTQMSFDFSHTCVTNAPSGLPEFSLAERVAAEVAVLGLDASAHVIDFYVPMLRALGVTRSSELLTCRSQQEILVGGVKVATQTPPIRSGRRVVFLTLDDGAGPVDATFFPDVQDPYAPVVFREWLLLVRGAVRRTGARGVSLRATGCWSLSALHEVWVAQGATGVYALLADSPRPAGSAQERQRHRLSTVGNLWSRSPFADVRPAGADATNARGMVPVPGKASGTAPGKLWHTSPGSPG